MKNKLKQKRESLGLSQWELAQASGVNWRMIQFYEQGAKDINKAQVVTLSKLADALGCEIKDLIDKPEDTREYIAIGKWQDDYDGAAIYSLVDQDGKRYIGQAMHLQKRLHQHRIALNKVARDGTTDVAEGMELKDAVLSGKRFHVEILKKLDWQYATKNMLDYWEGYYFREFGGFKETYNDTWTPEPRWDYEPHNEIELYVDFDKEEDKEFIAYLDSFEDPGEEIKRIWREHIKTK